MIVTVAVKDRNDNLLKRAPCRLRSRELAVEKVHVVVGNDDGVVHDDTQDQNQRRDGDLVQRNPMAFIAPRVMRSVMGMARAAITATRIGRSIMVTKMTDAMASMNSWLNV